MWHFLNSSWLSLGLTGSSSWVSHMQDKGSGVNISSPDCFLFWDTYLIFFEKWIHRWESFILEVGSHYVALAGVELCRSKWDPNSSRSASQVLGSLAYLSCVWIWACMWLGMGWSEDNYSNPVTELRLLGLQSHLVCPRPCFREIKT